MAWLVERMHGNRLRLSSSTYTTQSRAIKKWATTVVFNLISTEGHHSVRPGITIPLTRPSIGRTTCKYWNVSFAHPPRDYTGTFSNCTTLGKYILAGLASRTLVPLIDWLTPGRLSATGWVRHFLLTRWVFVERIDELWRVPLYIEPIEISSIDFRYISLCTGSRTELGCSITLSQCYL